ncbi:MAG: serine/threonine protein kinase [Verrucomicrobiales bacterium VVV1]|nr:MAG: serine/threonine protein kinase [Verrucomicrobiales bacterium VVV1]
MAWVALNCPQCSAPLPRVALWRSVTCGSCGALITRTESLVLRDTFRQALLRSKRGHAPTGQTIRCSGQDYQLLQSLGSGEISKVYLAQRIGTLPLLTTLKLSTESSAAKRYAREAEVLRELHRSNNDAARSFFSQNLPEIVAQGAVEDHAGQHALLLRHPIGYWGSLEALSERYPQGIDPRHAIWIWRRMLEILGVIHALGWSHGDIRPEHALVHPAAHGVRLIGWASAKNNASEDDRANDLLRSARIMRVLLNGSSAVDGVPNHVPAELAQLVTRAGQDLGFCRAQAAEGLDALLRAAAKAAYGPPSFVPLSI